MKKNLKLFANDYSLFYHCAFFSAFWALLGLTSALFGRAALAAFKDCHISHLLL
jgi:hypothetical protein